MCVCWFVYVVDTNNDTSLIPLPMNGCNNFKCFMITLAH